jgi:hypothetical protein
MWRENYGRDPIQAFGTVLNSPTDVFAAISTDGGDTFGKTMRLNAMASPVADPRAPYFDDMSYIILDRKFAYVVYGSWVSGEVQTWLRKIPLPPKG